VPDPGQMGGPCNSVYNNCIVPGTGTCGQDNSFNPPRPTGQCVGGMFQPDGTPCNSLITTQAVCITGTCTDLDDGFCQGQSAGVPCGVCRTGGTCDGNGHCSGGNPNSGSCG